MTNLRSQFRPRLFSDAGEPGKVSRKPAAAGSLGHALRSAPALVGLVLGALVLAGPLLRAAALPRPAAPATAAGPNRAAQDAPALDSAAQGADSQSAAQTSTQGSAADNPTHSPQPADTAMDRIEEHMAERRNADRQKMLVSDTEKLLALAQQLKLEVDKTDKNTLSIDVVKRAEQIEKLARSVKEKMRGN